MRDHISAANDILLKYFSSGTMWGYSLKANTKRVSMTLQTVLKYGNSSSIGNRPSIQRIYPTILQPSKIFFLADGQIYRTNFSIVRSSISAGALHYSTPHF